MKINIPELTFFDKLNIQFFEILPIIILIILTNLILITIRFIKDNKDSAPLSCLWIICCSGYSICCYKIFKDLKTSIWYDKAYKQLDK